MHTTIELITPIFTKGVRSLDDITPLESEHLTIRQSLISSGPSSIESEFDEALAVPGTLARAIEAERDGADALVIDCMGDPGMRACREVVGIPVLGAGQSALHIANMLGQRFSFITVLDRIRPMIDHLISGYGLAEHYASFRAIDIPVLELTHDTEALHSALASSALESVKQDGADVIVLGCTGFLGCAEAIHDALSDVGYKIPVVDPIPATVYMAEALVKLGLTQSGVTYPYPDKKPIRGFQIPGFETSQ